MGRIIPLIAKEQDGQAFPTPKVVYVNESNIKVFTPDEPLNVTTGKGVTTKVIETLPSGHKTIYEVYERAIEIEVMRNPSTTDLILKAFVNAALAGAGTTQGAGTALSKYFNEALTIGAAATEAFTLPAATVGKVRIIMNNDVAGDAAKIFPAVGEFILPGAVNIVKSIAGGTRLSLVCLVIGKWTIAVDNGQR